MTKIFGVIGDPIEHTLSPVMHNAGYTALGLKDYRYDKWAVKPSELKLFVDEFRADDSKLGFNVTVPHKSRIVKYLDDIDYKAQHVGAVNTVIKVNGQLHGTNTDVDGFWNAFSSVYGQEIKDKYVIIFGAGGASRAVCASLIEHKVGKLALVNDVLVQVKDLLVELHRYSDKYIEAYKVDSYSIKNVITHADVIINATPIGMAPHVDQSVIISTDWLNSGQFIFDLVYVPSETLLMKQIRAQGGRADNGLRMLIHQGVKAFELFTGQKISADVFHKALNLTITL